MAVVLLGLTALLKPRPFEPHTYRDKPVVVKLTMRIALTRDDPHLAMKLPDMGHPTRS
ncbi:MAG: hypothetical protein JST61_00080 [Acidobacteria bacterium]|nr:hypothetical protein [Acidobacteriota bacterium]